MDYIMIVPCIVGICLLLVVFILLNNNTLYCKFFYKDEYKLFNLLINLDINEFTFYKREIVYDVITVDIFKCYRFPTMKFNVINGERSFISSSDDNRCILSSFYKKGSKQLAEKLMTLI